MSADPFKTLRDRQLEYQAEPVVLVDPATGEAGAIKLSGRTAVDVGGTSFQTDGSVIYGLAADIPDAAAAHAVVPYCFYYAVDTGTLYRNTGSAWVS